MKSSKAEQVGVSFTNKFPLTKPFSERYLKKLIGKNDIEDVLKRLDKLTQEEARMAAVQLLKVPNTINNRVTGIADNVLGKRVVTVGIDNKLASVDKRVLGVDDRVKDINDRSAAVINSTHYIFNQSSKPAQLLTDLDGKEARGVIQQTADDVDQVKRSWSLNYSYYIHVKHAGSSILTGIQLRKELRRWLSPPDPSTSHNIAFNAHHRGTATWFFKGRTYKEWKSTGSESLLWIHGKRVPQSHSAA